MITLKEVKKQISDITNRRWHEHEGKEKKAAAKRLKFLNLMKIYLESDPTPTFVKNEIDRVQNNIDILMSRFSFSEVTNLKVFNDARKKYEKDNLIPKMKEQLKALKFLLKK